MKSNINAIKVYSRNDFEEKMYRLDLDRFNVGNEEDKAFIQIIETDDCIKHYNEEGITNYWFVNTTADNVLNIAFDDVNEDEFVYHGTTFKGITDEQAELIVDFIEKHKGKNWYLSCRAGRSRSQAISKYILDMYGEEYGYIENESCRKDNPCKTPNINVLTKLKRAFYKKFNLFN